MSNEQIYLYRRKGLSDYATCDRARYVELSQHKLFETMICYTSLEPEEGDHDGRQLEWERAENKRLREALEAARNDLLAVSHLAPGDYIPKSVASAEAAIASAEPSEPTCCTTTAEEKALLASGDYTPEELWGASKPSCPKCHKVEPANKESEQ